MCSMLYIIIVFHMIYTFPEAIVKMVGLRYHYFTVPWNMFDFLLVLASILGILMEDIMIDLPVSPTLLRVVRVFRIGRILRLIKVNILYYNRHFSLFKYIKIVYIIMYVYI